MRIAYVDDTKQRGRRRDMGQLVALGAAIFDEDQIQPFAHAFRALYDEFGVPYDVELKWSNPQGRNWWAEADENKAKQTPMRQRVLEMAQVHNVRVIVVVWDQGGGVATPESCHLIGSSVVEGRSALIFRGWGPAGYALMPVNRLRRWGCSSGR